MKIAFAKQQIDKNEIRSVIKTLKSGILVHGSKTNDFEKKIHKFINFKKA